MDAPIKNSEFHNSHLLLDGLTSEEILNLIINENVFENKINLNREKLLTLIEIFRDRSKTLLKMCMHLNSICAVPTTYDSEYLDELINDNTAYHIEMLIKRLELSTIEWNEESVTELLKSFSKEFDIKIAYIAHIIRLSLIGKSDGPGMYKMLSMLDRDDVIKRLKKFRSYIL